MTGDRLTLETADEHAAWTHAAGCALTSGMHSEAYAHRLADGVILASREREPDEDRYWTLGEAIRAALFHYEDEYGGGLAAAWEKMGRTGRTMASEQLAELTMKAHKPEVRERVEGAYRERCASEPSDAPRINTGGCYGTHLILPPDWELDMTPGGEWRVTDAGEPSRAFAGPDAEELARRAWKHWARSERGPTEGASDAIPREVVNHERLLVASPSAAVIVATALAKHDHDRERPPTGEASPETVEDRARPLAGLGFEMTGKMSKAMHVIPEPLFGRDDPIHVARELNAEAEAIIARHSPEPSVPDAPGWWWLWSPTSLTRREWRPQHVREYDEGLCFRYLDQRHNIADPEKVFKWGGRCLRGAPVSDLVSRLIAVAGKPGDDLDDEYTGDAHKLSQLRMLLADAALDTAKGET